MIQNIEYCLILIRSKNMSELELILSVKETIAKKSENTDIEFNAANKGTLEKLYDTLSSFSNTNGGTIIFGIDERKDY